MSKTREEKVIAIAKSLAEGGWSSIYSYVDSHFEENDYIDEEEEDEDE